ncbi:MAG: hypothetical protein K8Q89_03415 [Nitrosarchaeum sp.]|nr:hypothetical protein [Nitrosarchaeum sp.]
MDKVKIPIRRETRKRLRPLCGEGESYDTAINRMINYIEFHPEYWDRKI